MIQRLSDDVISKIAAGEVITAPYNIIKELIENSIDANATKIIVKIDSTLNFILVEDNGTGILFSDFEKVCERHCTSKYTKNLLKLTTFGFRGEALSSISLVSKVSIESKRSECEIGYKAVYNGNKLHYTKKQAMQNGTVVTINDIFHNNKIHKKYFYKRKEEVSRIYYLISNYTIYNNEIIFMLYKDDKLLNICDSMQSKSSIEYKKHLIKCIYNINNGLCEYKDAELLLLHTNIYSYVNIFTLILFVNGRLVNNKILKEKVKNLYAPHIPKSKYAFVYIELTVSDVDVNVHPEKKEVLFMNEEETYQKIVDEIEQNLQEQIVIEQRKKEIKFENSVVLPKKIIYTNPANSSLIDIFYDQSSQIESNETQKIFMLDSIKKLKDKLVKIVDFYPEKLVFVGLSGENMMLQYETLLLQYNSMIIKKYFHQRLLFDFGNFKSKKINKKHNITCTKNHKKILSEYFMIHIEDEFITQIPVINKTSIETDLDNFLSFFTKLELQNEEKVFNITLDKLAILFVKNYVNDESNFNMLKRNIIITNELKNEFKVLTSLNELYKLFERC